MSYSHQERLAELADVHENHVRLIEHGEANPAFLVVLRIARALVDRHLHTDGRQDAKCLCSLTTRNRLITDDLRISFWHWNVGDDEWNV